MPGGSSSVRTLPPGRIRSRTRRSRAIGSPPMPMLPSASRTCRPAAVAGERSNRSRQSAAAPRASSTRPAVGLVDAECERPRRSAPDYQPARAAADVEGRPEARGQPHRVEAAVCAVPTQPSRHRPSMHAPFVATPSNSRSPEQPGIDTRCVPNGVRRLIPLATRSVNLLCRRTGLPHPLGVLDRVHVGQHRSAATCSSRSCNASRVRRPVSDSRHRNVAQALACNGS